MSREIAKEYSNAYGHWNVTTEGDCEGRTVKNLGSYLGFIDEIAHRLSTSAYYSLRFDPSRTLEGDRNPCPSCGGTGLLDYNLDLVDPRGDSIHISLGIRSGIWDMTREERAQVVGEVLADRPVRVEPGDYYASVLLKFGERS